MTPHPRRYFWVRFAVTVTCGFIPVASLVVFAVKFPPVLLAEASASAGVSSGPDAAVTPKPSASARPSHSGSLIPTSGAQSGIVGTPPTASASPGFSGKRGVIPPVGVLLPDRSRTPGVANPAVTQQTIGQTICRAGWVASVRPAASATESLKRRQLASGYSFNGDLTPSHYEEDHLISIGLGGAPMAEGNLWPEPYSGPGDARLKNIVEDRLHGLVCLGAVTLTVAQQAIATNWWVAYQRYVLTPVQIPSASQAPVPAVPDVPGSHTAARTSVLPGNSVVPGASDVPGASSLESLQLPETRFGMRSSSGGDSTSRSSRIPKTSAGGQASVASSK